MKNRFAAEFYSSVDNFVGLEHVKFRAIRCLIKISLAPGALYVSSEAGKPVALGAGC